jgi:hypothetical protein
MLNFRGAPLWGGLLALFGPKRLFLRINPQINLLTDFWRSFNEDPLDENHLYKSNRLFLFAHPTGRARTSSPLGRRLPAAHTPHRRYRGASPRGMNRRCTLSPSIRQPMRLRHCPRMGKYPGGTRVRGASLLSFPLFAVKLTILFLYKPKRRA